MDAEQTNVLRRRYLLLITYLLTVYWYLLTTYGGIYGTHVNQRPKPYTGFTWGRYIYISI